MYSDKGQHADNVFRQMKLKALDFITVYNALIASGKRFRLMKSIKKMLYQIPMHYIFLLEFDRFYCL